MTHKELTVSEVIDIIKSDNSLDDFAFRGDDFVPVCRFRKSKYHGDDGPERQLGGVSAVNVPSCEPNYIIEAMCLARKYGNAIFLLRGTANNNYDGDYGEVLMSRYKIVGIVNAEFIKIGFDYKIKVIA